MKEAWSAADTLVLAIWLAMVAGLGEGLFRLYQSWGRGTAIWMSPHVIWMAPTANLLWLLGPLGLVVGLDRFYRWKTKIVHVLILYFIAVLSLILLYRGMHKGAAVLLALGVASQLAPRTLGWTAFRRRIRRSLPILLLLPVAGGLAIAGNRWHHERQMLTALPPAGTNQPNVLLIVWDTVRDFNTSLGGYGRPTTPFLERLSGEAAHFRLALATAPWTLPSHASMFTGQRPSALSTRHMVPLDRKDRVLAEAFGQQGYVTGGFVANTFYCSREFGLGRGFSHYEDYRISFGGILGSSRLGIVLLGSDALRRAIGYFDLPGRKTASLVNQEFLGWLSRRGDRPFFAFLNYFDTHLPFVPAEPFRSRLSFDTQSSFRPRPGDVTFADMTTEEIRWSMGEYDAAIAYLDAQVEELLRVLQSRDMLENTVVVITSDHGEHFGDHQRISHGNTLYRQLLQVPLVIRFPSRIPGGTVVNQPVSLADLPRTLMDLSGIDDGLFPGESLARYWSGETQPEKIVLSEMPTVTGAGAYSLFANGYHYVKWFDTPVELYRVDVDPEEIHDLASLPESAGRLEEFQALEASFVRLPQDQKLPAEAGTRR